MARAQAVRHAPEPRRDQVLRVAEALFARAGYRGVGLREIAAQVGIRAPSLFKHFESKRALFNAVLLNIFTRLLELARRLEDGGPFPERLQEFIDGYVELVAGDPHVVALIFREMMERSDVMEPATRGAAYEIYRRIDAFLDAGQRAGQFRAGDRFTFQIALSGAILYHGLAARPYQAALLDGAGRADIDTWKATLHGIARGALLVRAAPYAGLDRTAPRRVVRKATVR
jgi:AcrR family transcriptional regulator